MMAVTHSFQIKLRLLSLFIYLFIYSILPYNVLVHLQGLDTISTFVKISLRLSLKFNSRVYKKFTIIKHMQGFIPKL